MHSQIILKELVPCTVFSTMMLGYCIIVSTPRAFKIVPTMDTKRGIMYGDRWSPNHMEMKETELAATMTKMGVNASLKAGRLKKVRNKPEMYTL